jgi:hypothetical protein
MITANRQRRYAGRMNGSEEGSDLRERPLQLEGLFDPGVPQIRDADEIERRYAGRLIDLADERRVDADIAWAVARAGAVGDATIERCRPRRAARYEGDGRRSEFRYSAVAIAGPPAPDSCESS